MDPLFLCCRPTKEQEQEDRDLAFNAGVPRGYIQPGERDAHHPRITLTVRSEIHTNNEYGLNVDSEGRHFGGPFELEVQLDALACGRCSRRVRLKRSKSEV